jgi:ADP-sugar diphosphatase
MSAGNRGSTPLLRIYHEDDVPAIILCPENLSDDEFVSVMPRPHPSQDVAFGFSALDHWLTRLQYNLRQQKNPANPFHLRPYHLLGFDVQAVDWLSHKVPNRQDKLGVMKIHASIATEAHDSVWARRNDVLPGAVLLKGGSLAILVRRIMPSQKNI